MFFLIEPQYTDADTFCHFTVGSRRARASISIYADIGALLGVADALEASRLEQEWPPVSEHYTRDDRVFMFLPTVLPHEGDGLRQLRFRVYQEYLDDGAPYRADIRFQLTQKDAEEFARDLRTWCREPVSNFLWIRD